MSKILKLTGLASYVAACTNGIVIKRGQSAKFDNNHADALLRGARKDKEGEPISYFVEQPEDSKFDLDFTTSTDTPVKGKPEDVQKSDETVTLASATRKVSRQRTAATTATV